MRFLLSLSISLILATGSIGAAGQVITERATLPADRIVMPGDVLPQAPFVESEPWSPRRDDLIGEAILAGDTWYDYMSNGSIGKFIAVDPDDRVHVTWMDSYDIVHRDRHQQYNFLEGDEWWEDSTGAPVDEGRRSGYGCLWLTTEEEPRIMIFTHAGNELDGSDQIWIGCVDFMPGFGAFLITVFPGFQDARVLWPQGVMSPEGIIHVVGNDLGGDDPGRLGYLPAYIDDDGGIDFDVDVPFEVGSTHLNTYRIARSQVSERAAITWMDTRVGNPAPPLWEGYLAWQMNNDLYMAWTDDGENWNFDDPLNVTQCIMPDARREGNSIYGDTLLPYCSHDIIFDSEDNIHIVFEVRGLWWDPLEEQAPPVRRGGDPVDEPGLTVDKSYLFHWSEATEEFTPVADGWFSQLVYSEENPDSAIIWPSPGAWRSNVCYPSLAYDDNDDLYCVFNYYPYGDYNDIVGRGRCNGDVAVTVSEDNGETWYYPTMVVETPSPLAEPGEAFAEGYPTVAEMVDDYLHIFYLIDKEAGTTIQDDNASNTLNPEIYQAVPVDEILRDAIWEDGPLFHMQFRPLVENGTRNPGVPTPDVDVHVSATCTPDADHELEEVVLLYRIDEGDEQSVEMENTGGDVYEADIPGQEEGTSVWYRIRASNDIGIAGYGPSNIWYWSYVVREEGELTMQDIQMVPRVWGIDQSPYMGYEVTVTGIVTSPVTFNDEYGAYTIQDPEGGDWSGIFIRGLDEAELTEGDILEVTGTVMETEPDPEDDIERNRWKSTTYIDVIEDGYQVVEHTDKPEALVVDLGELIEDERGEQLEGVFIHALDFEIAFILQGNVELGYWPITNNTGDSWFTTNGLTEEAIQERHLYNDPDGGLVTGTRIEWMNGVLTDVYNIYAIAPTQADDVGELAVQDGDQALAYHFKLENAYPNPFNAMTSVSFELSMRSAVRLALYDLNGREVFQLAGGEMDAGRYSFSVDASSLASGVYILRLDAGQVAASQKLVLMK